MSCNNSLSNYTREELCALYKNLQEKLSNSNCASTISQRQAELIYLMHEFNDIKDACQTVLGALATRNQTTIKEMHCLYGLPLTDSDE